MKKFIIYIGLSIFSISAFTQNITHLKEISATLNGSAIQSVQLYSDSNSTVFVILIKNEVKPHYHQNHTESIMVLEGMAEMRLNDSTMTIKAGDFFVIPPQTIHSVRVSSEIPLKVVSIQAPEFLGEDRHFVEN